MEGKSTEERIAGLKNKPSNIQLLLGIGGFGVLVSVVALALYLTGIVNVGLAIGIFVFGLVVTISLILYYTGWGYAVLFTRSRPFSEDWGTEVKLNRSLGLKEAGRLRQGAEIQMNFTLAEMQIARRLTAKINDKAKKKSPEKEATEFRKKVVEDFRKANDMIAAETKQVEQESKEFVKRSAERAKRLRERASSEAERVGKKARKGLEESQDSLSELTDRLGGLSLGEKRKSERKDSLSDITDRMGGLSLVER